MDDLIKLLRYSFYFTIVVFVIFLIVISLPFVLALF